MKRPAQRDQMELRAIIEPVVSRIIRARITDGAIVHDLTEDTIARVLEANDRLHINSVLGYAAVSAHNAIRMHWRTLKREKQAHDRAWNEANEVTESLSPEFEYFERSKQYALDSALQQLTPEDRKRLFDHHIENRNLADIAANEGVSTHAIAAKLARTRATVRMNYILAAHNFVLPHATCRPVLMSISTGEKRQQQRLDAGAHLQHCEVCAQIAPLLLKRDRGLLALAPIGMVWDAMRQSAQWFRSHPAHSAVAATAAAGAIAVLALPTHAPPATQAAPISITREPVQAPAQQPTCATVLNVAGRFPQPQQQSLPMTDGEQVHAVSAQVFSPVTSQGFWVGCESYRLWVSLSSPSKQVPQSGSHVSFSGTIRRHHNGYGTSVGLSALSAQQLDTAAYHAVVESFEAHA